MHAAIKLKENFTKKNVRKTRPQEIKKDTWMP
jgi:hypothetical protein